MDHKHSPPWKETSSGGWGEGSDHKFLIHAKVEVLDVQKQVKIEICALTKQKNYNKKLKYDKKTSTLVDKI